MAKELVRVEAGAVVEGNYRRPNYTGDGSTIRVYVLKTFLVRGEPRILVTRNPKDVSDEALQVLYLGAFDAISTVIEEGEPIAEIDVSNLFVNPRNPRYGYLERFDEAHAAMAQEIYGSFPLSEVVTDYVTFVRYVPTE